jgi:arginyl-tRNA--protein-N-Asp/Glu arginylyltransferase
MFNIQNSQSVEVNYSHGLLPQRNLPGTYYRDSSCRSNISDFSLSSENRRILRKTENFTFQKMPIFFNLEIQKQIFGWLKGLDWNFPISSVKSIFTQHIFNYLYIWSLNQKVNAYSVCYFSDSISHIAYVFYNPEYSHSDLPIRLVLQTIIDSQSLGLKYCYLGRYSDYKRNMPGFENFIDNQWQ